MLKRICMFVAFSTLCGLTYGQGQLATHQSGAGLGVKTVSTGQLKTIYNSNQGAFVEGTNGEEYELYIVPPRNVIGRCLAVISVDGVNVISGQAAKPTDTRGTVINSGQPVSWKGYLQNNNLLSRFKFTSAVNSLANLRGHSDSPGVISVSFYSEKVVQPQVAVTKYRTETRQRTLSDGSIQNYTVDVPYTTNSTRRVLSAPAPAGYSASDTGTTGGTKIDPNVRNVKFTAGNLLGRIHLRYASLVALQNAGVANSVPQIPTYPSTPTVPTPPIVPTPQPFRPNPYPGYAPNPFPEFGG